MKKIFLSYCWRDIEAINKLDNMFTRFNISITRDIRDLDYNANIHQFMDTVSTYDKILMYISNDYLRSVNCMYEAAQALNAPEKIVVVLQQGTKIFNPEDKENLIEYWKNKYTLLCEKNQDHYKQEIENTKIAVDIVVPLIDFITQEKRMFNDGLSFGTLLNSLQVEMCYSTILTKNVVNWISHNPKQALWAVLDLISDLYDSTFVVFSEYPNIPDNEKRYLFKKIAFSQNISGINLSIVCTDIKSGEDVFFECSRLIEIEENSMRSDVHSKFYFHCENPSKKQHFNELLDRKQSLEFKAFTTEEQELLSCGYLDTYRITIYF